MKKILIALIFLGILMFSCHLDKLTDPSNGCLNPPAASFSIEGGGGDCQAPCTVKFINSSTNAISYKLKFGDGDSTTFTSGEIFHTYDSVGVFSASLIAFGDNNCPSSTITKQVTVTSIGCPNPPAALFSIQGGGANCQAPCSIKFINNSTNATSYLLKFGDGDSTTNFTSGEITHVYDTAGVYTPSLTAWGNTNCPVNTYTPTQPITVTQVGVPPIAAFTYDLSNNSGFAPCNVIFTNNSIDGISYEWNFGDGSPISNSINPSHFYQFPGDYTVTLKTSNNFGANIENKTVNIKSIKFIKDIFPPESSAGFAIQSNDGGYIVIGATQTQDIQPKFSLYASKFDFMGNPGWNLDWYEGAGYSSGVHIIGGNNAPGYGFLGNSSQNGQESDYIISNFTEDGTIIRVTGFGDASAEYSTSITLTNEVATSIVVGLKRTQSSSDYNVFATKILAGQYSDITKEYDLKLSPVNTAKIIPTKDGNFIIATNKKVGNNFQPYLIKVDQDLNTISEVLIPIDLILGDIEEMDNSDLLLSGIWGNFKVLHLSAGGSLISEMSYGTNQFEVGALLTITPDGNYAIAGSFSPPTGGTEIYLAKINSNTTDIIWENSIGSQYVYIGPKSLQNCNDGGYILSATAGDGTLNGNRAVLVKTDKDGNAN